MRNLWGWNRRFKQDHGVTIPEYALMLSAMVVASMGAIQVLEDNADEQMNDTADCIGKLPSEAGCGVGAEEVPPDPEDPTSDPDGDTIPNSDDNCPSIFNSDQADYDLDGQGDVCDATPHGDDDNDGIDNFDDLCPTVSHPPADGPQADDDNDGNGNECDLCPDYNDLDDFDGDGVPGLGVPPAGGCDNCYAVSNAGVPDTYPVQQTDDIDSDGIGDPCDPSSTHVERTTSASGSSGGYRTMRLTLTITNNLGDSNDGTGNVRYQTCTSSSCPTSTWSGWTNSNCAQTSPATTCTISVSVRCSTSGAPRVRTIRWDFTSLAATPAWDNDDPDPVSPPYTQVTVNSC